MGGDSVIRGIADVLQRVYDDATQTALDRHAAAEVYAYVLSCGMAPLETVAAIVEAAGGDVTVPSRLLIDPPVELFVVDEPQVAGRRLVTKPKAL
jgi:hypothetical protein